MKLDPGQLDKLRAYLDHVAWIAELETEEVMAAVLAIVETEPPMDDDAIYARFMQEWKQVGVWQGGKPIRAKLARLAKAKQLDNVWAGLERLRNDPNRPAAEFVPRPMTWLNQERWNDDPYPEKSGGRVAAAGAVLNIQLDHIQPVISRQGMQAIERQRGPGIADELQQGRW